MNPLVKSLGAQWRKPIPASYRAQHAKWDNREERIAISYGLAKRCLPEYLQGPPRRVLDVSCGAGAWLEIMRHHGNEVLGVDIQYFPFLESQGIPYVVHDCSRFPYPFADASHDLVTCIGSISNYAAPWGDVLAEFFRIAARTVFLCCNQGDPHDENRAMLRRHCPPGWRQSMVRNARYRWDRTG